MRRPPAQRCGARSWSAEDHGSDPAILQRWLANKTPETFRRWLGQRGQSYLLAEEDGAVLAVGGVEDGGEILLNYVSPDARFRGVSRAMLRALEARAAARGAIRCTLASTVTARRFYLEAGYVEDGGASGAFGMQSGFRMTKPLAAGPSQAATVAG